MTLGAERGFGADAGSSFAKFFRYRAETEGCRVYDIMLWLIAEIVQV